MIITSLDILYVIIAICVGVFTGFLCWMMYYAVQILKQGNEVIADIRQKLTEFEDMLGNIKDKVIASATSVTFIASEIGSVMDIIRSFKRRKESTGRRKRKDKSQADEDQDEE